MFSISKILKRSPNEFCFCMIKHISNNRRIILVPELNHDVLQGHEVGTMTSKKHPGKVPRNLTEFDDKMLHTIQVVVKDSIRKNLLKDAAQLCRYLRARHPPVTKSDYNERKLAYSYEVMDKMKIDLDQMPEEKTMRLEKVFGKQVSSMLKQRIYNWSPVNYSTYVGKQYLVNRMVAEMAALNRIFSEIALRNPNFRPTSLFDFGSGVGTVTWAVQKRWSDSLEECYNVDSSPEMNEIAELLLKGGDENGMIPIPHVYYRQFLPTTSERRYNLVVCSYTLFELPSMENRLQTISNLWNKTKDFLVIVEQGTAQGFKLIREARDFLLETTSMNESSDIHIFSPCPHELSCPLTRVGEKPCCFKASYSLPPIGRKAVLQNEYYSFVVFRKEKRPEIESWPRVLRNAYSKKQCSRCRLCCPDGKLRTVTFTKCKQGKTNVQLLRNSKSCDRLPITLREVNIDEVMDVSDAVSSEEIMQDFSDEESDDEVADSKPRV